LSAMPEQQMIHGRLLRKRCNHKLKPMLHKPKHWASYQEMQDMLGMSYEAIVWNIHNSPYKHSIWKEGARGESMVDRNYYANIINRNIKILNEAHDLYYNILQYGNELTLSKILGLMTNEKYINWQMFMQKNLFKPHGEDRMPKDASGKVIDFLIYGSKILHLLKNNIKVMG